MPQYLYLISKKVVVVFVLLAKNPPLHLLFHPILKTKKQCSQLLLNQQFQLRILRFSEVVKRYHCIPQNLAILRIIKKYLFTRKIKTSNKVGNTVKKQPSLFLFRSCLVFIMLQKFSWDWMADHFSTKNASFCRQMVFSPFL